MSAEKGMSIKMKKIEDIIVKTGIVVSITLMIFLLTSLLLRTFRDFLQIQGRVRISEEWTQLESLLPIFSFGEGSFGAHFIVALNFIIALGIVIVIVKWNVDIKSFIKENSMLDKNFLSIVLFLLFVLIGYIFLRLNVGELRVDPLRVRDATISFYYYGILGDSGVRHFSVVPINLGYLWYNIIAVHIFGPANLDSGLFLMNNSLFALVLLFMRNSLKKVYSEHGIKIFNIILCALVLFLPLANFQSYFYTFLIMTYSLLFVISILIRCEKRELSYAAIILISVILTVGNIDRRTTILMGIAFSIYLLIMEKKITKKLCSVMVMVVIIGTTNAFVAFNYNFHDLNISREALPTSYWIRAGQNTESRGRNNVYDNRANLDAISEGRNEEINQENIEITIERIRDRGIVGNIEFYADKLSWAWGSGDFDMYTRSTFASNHRDIDPDNEQSIMSFALTNESYVIRFLLNIYILIFYMLFVYYIQKAFREKEYWTSYFLVFMLTFSGMILFSMLSEIAPRRVFPVIPALIYVTIHTYFKKINDNEKK